MIVLKKFTLSGKKIEDRIKYSHELDVRKYSEGHCGETKYNLLSVIVHKGTKSTKGHYYCYTKRNKKDWIYCNDEEIQIVQ
jgi:ubiquitin C-terminal hydrolase